MSDNPVLLAEERSAGSGASRCPPRRQGPHGPLTWPRRPSPLMFPGHDLFLIVRGKNALVELKIDGPS